MIAGVKFKCNRCGVAEAITNEADAPFSAYLREIQRRGWRVTVEAATGKPAEHTCPSCPDGFADAPT